MTSFQTKVSKLNFFTRMEVAELPKLLLPGEQIWGVISGFYTAGSAVLCATSMRVLLVDKKLIRLNIEDVRYESISEVDFSRQLFIASTHLHFAGRSLQFRSIYRRELRQIIQYIQSKMFEVRRSHSQMEAPLSTQPQMTPQISANYVWPEPTQPNVSQITAEQRLAERLRRWQQAGKFISDLETPEN